MKFVILSITMLLVLAGLIPIEIINPAYAQEFTIEEIKNNLLNNPPNTGNPSVREETILALDAILLDDSSRTAQSVFNFYTFMMEKVKKELQEDVSGEAAIWIMYNQGFVIKTSRIVFAFDLVDGYYGWTTYLPPELIKQIKVLFISHCHGDHYDKSVVDTVMAYGGYVVVPSEDSYMGNVPMAAGDSLTILGLHIKAHYGLHNAPVRIHEVTCPNGLKFLHTGDNQTSETLPEVDSLDVLLLNAWVNESGSATAVVGMRNCIDRLKPTVMIPGHIQELGHGYSPGNPTSRVPYEWAFEVDDEPVAAEVQVMAWGERYFAMEEFVGIREHKESLSFPKSFVLRQNYPNPFNPQTTIRYNLPQAGAVWLSVYNVLGQIVRTLVDGQRPAGTYSVVWDGRDSSGRDVASGVYLYRLKVKGQHVQTRRMVLLR